VITVKGTDPLQAAAVEESALDLLPLYCDTAGPAQVANSSAVCNLFSGSGVIIPSQILILT